MWTYAVRNWRKLAIGLMILSSGTLCSASCSAAWKIFRGEASQNIGEGVKTILSGVIDGIVAVVDPTDAQSQAAAGN